MAIVKASESPFNDVSPIKTGTIIDKLSGIYGIPRKRITEIFGDSGVGKSSLCLQAVKQAQQQGLRVLWSDVEWSYDGNYAQSLGVDNGNLGLLQTRHAEDILDELEQAIDKGTYDLIILDSIGGLLPRQEAEKGAGEKTIGGQAGLVARFCRKVVPLLALRNVALVVINHSFTDIMSGAIKTSGGAKLEYHKSLSIRLKKTNRVLKSGEKIIGKVIVGQVKKNKLAATEGMELEAQMVFGSGFSSAFDLLDEALAKGIIEKRGQTYWFSQEKLGQISKAREWIKEETNAEKIRTALA